MYEPGSHRARCRFKFVDQNSVEKVLNIPIFAYNTSEKYVQCIVPQAYVQSEELLDTNGGDVDLFISSNGVNFSQSSTPITYRLSPIIQKVEPYFIPEKWPNELSATGLNFHDKVNNEVQYVLVSSIRNPQRNETTPLTFIN